MGEAARARLLYRLLQGAGLRLVHALCRLDLEGLEHVPPVGPLVVAPNHLHSLDIPLLGALIPRHQCVLAADKWRGTPGGWLMEAATEVIYISRGEPDRKALAASVELLKRGWALAIAPEGTRSRSGGLLPGKNGTAYLAVKAGAPILPVAMWGQERALGELVRFRRPRIGLRFAPCLQPGSNGLPLRSAEIDSLTERLMLTIAGMLPSEYRGHYRESLAERTG